MSREPRYSLLLWDADGVVVDSSVVAWEAANRLLAVFDFPQRITDKASYRKYFSRAVQRDLCGDADAPALRALHRVLMMRYASRVRLFEPVLALIRQISVPSQIVSSAYGIGIRQALGDQATSFTEIAGYEGGRKADQLMSFADRRDVLYVTDSVADIERCRSARIDVVAVAWGYDSPDTLASASPIGIMRTVEELERWLDKANLLQPR